MTDHSPLKRKAFRPGQAHIRGGVDLTKLDVSAPTSHRRPQDGYQLRPGMSPSHHLPGSPQGMNSGQQYISSPTDYSDSELSIPDALANSKFSPRPTPQPRHLSNSGLQNNTPLANYQDVYGRPVTPDLFSNRQTDAGQMDAYGHPTMPSKHIQQPPVQPTPAGSFKGEPSFLENLYHEEVLETTARLRKAHMEKQQAEYARQQRQQQQWQRQPAQETRRDSRDIPELPPVHPTFVHGNSSQHPFAVTQQHLDCSHPTHNTTTQQRPPSLAATHPSQYPAPAADDEQTMAVQTRRSKAKANPSDPSATDPPTSTATPPQNSTSQTGPRPPPRIPRAVKRAASNSTATPAPPATRARLTLVPPRAPKLADARSPWTPPTDSGVQTPTAQQEKSAERDTAAQIAATKAAAAVASNIRRQRPVVPTEAPYESPFNFTGVVEQGIPGGSGVGHDSTDAAAAAGGGSGKTSLWDISQQASNDFADQRERMAAQARALGDFDTSPTAPFDGTAKKSLSDISTKASNDFADQREQMAAQMAAQGSVAGHLDTSPTAPSDGTASGPASRTRRHAQQQPTPQRGPPQIPAQEQPIAPGDISDLYAAQQRMVAQRYQGWHASTTIVPYVPTSTESRPSAQEAPSGVSTRSALDGMTTGAAASTSTTQPGSMWGHVASLYNGGSPAISPGTSGFGGTSIAPEAASGTVPPTQPGSNSHTPASSSQHVPQFPPLSPRTLAFLTPTTAPPPPQPQPIHPKPPSPPPWTRSLDPMMQTSTRIRGANGPLRGMGPEAHSALPNVISPTNMVGLPFGGVVEQAAEYCDERVEREREMIE